MTETFKGWFAKKDTQKVLLSAIWAWIALPVFTLQMAVFRTYID